MPRRAVSLIGLALSLCGVAGTPAAADPSRLALVIGNSTYAGLPPVPACAASVAVVSAALKRAGFEVTERLNVSNGRMGAGITEFGDAIARTPGSTAIAYVCGYAVGFDGRVFLLPASASLERETDALTQGVVARLLVSTVVNSDAKAGLVLLDSIAKPGNATPVPLAALVNPATLGSKGFAAVHSIAAPPGGPTPLAGAIVAGLLPPEVETRTLLGEIRAALQGVPGLTTVVHDPTSPAWLTGGPVPVAPVPVAAPAIAAAPAPARLPTLPPAPTPPPEPPPVAPLVQAVPPVVAPRVPAGPFAPNEADRRRLQLALQRLGYYAGKVDGTYGPDSLAAIRRFQHELGADMTGRLTAEQAARLLADSR